MVAAGGVLANAAGALFLWAYLSAGHGKVKLRIRGIRLVRQHLQDILRVGAVACISPFQSVLTILILTRLVTSFSTEALRLPDWTYARAALTASCAAALGGCLASSFAASGQFARCRAHPPRPRPCWP
jgi:Na+-driven multidrug efflux pump